MHGAMLPPPSPQSGFYLFIFFTELMSYMLSIGIFCLQHPPNEHLSLWPTQVGKQLRFSIKCLAFQAKQFSFQISCNDVKASLTVLFH